VKWLVENRQWLFSGVGVFILAAIARWLYQQFLLRKVQTTSTAVTAVDSSITKSQSEPAPSSGVNPPTSVPAQQRPVASPLLKLTLRQVVDEICDAPYLQRSQIEQNYLGMRMRISGRVRCVASPEDDLAEVVVGEGAFGWPEVYFSVKLSEHPELRLFKDKMPVVVEGIYAGRHNSAWGWHTLTDPVIVEYGKSSTNQQ
jgi:hypothetical protein